MSTEANSFYFQVDDLIIKADYPLTDEQTDEGWQPPKRPNGYEQKRSHTYKWSIDRASNLITCVPLADLPSTLQLVEAATFFTRNPEDRRIIGNDIDALRQSPAHPYTPIGFYHQKHDNSVMSRVGINGPKPSLAAPDGGQAWVKDLLETTYHYDEPKNKKHPQNGGLIGDIKIILAFVAFSCPVEKKHKIFMENVRKGKWIHHEEDHGRRAKRGVVVRIFVNPASNRSVEETKQLVQSLGAGRYGRIF